ncbi:hypothetical protein Tco_1582046 [Tanacetum coccineum]
MAFKGGIKNGKEIRELKEKAVSLELKDEYGGLNPTDIEARLTSIERIDYLEHINNSDVMQKAKVKWAVEGDENSKKIHGLVNHNISRSKIEGISINGTWIKDPKLVISHIFDFYKYKFHDHLLNRPHFTSSLFKTLPDFEVHFLDVPFSINEIKTAVWDCGNSKAPSPDVFTFNFIKQLEHGWELFH